MYREFFVWATGRNVHNTHVVYHWMRDWRIGPVVIELHAGVDYSQSVDPAVVNLMIVVRW